MRCDGARAKSVQGNCSSARGVGTNAASTTTSGRIVRALMLASIALICSAHIGSPDAWFDGAAGPYQVLVHVRAPSVVPGIAVISIKPNEKVDTVTAFVNKFDAVAGAPPPDVAKPVPNESGWYRTDLWVMDPGSNSVTVSVHGAKGEGTVVVPLVAVAGRRLEFDGVLTAVLGVAAIVLVVGLLTLVGAAVRESVLPPGVQPDTTRRKRARWAMVRGAVTIVVVVAGLGAWWRMEDSLFAQNLFKPFTVSAHTQFVEGAGNQLILTITDSAWTERHITRRTRPRGGSERTTLVDDHQKLMHLFVIAENGQTNFAHLHPTTTDSVSFTSVLPPLPAGRYRVFADVLHATGLTQTLTTTVTLEAPRGSADPALSDTDDAWITGVAESSGATSRLADGSSLTWLGAPAQHIVGEEAALRFGITLPVGDTARLEPYLGMLGHAVVVRDDGAVFIHLHPMGTISMGAQTMLSRGRTSVHDMAMAGTPATAMRGDTLHFPYAFPNSGNYTVWVQVKRHGRVLTGAFRVAVAADARRGAP